MDSFTISATNGIDVVSQQVEIDIFEDVGLPFNPNTSLGQHQLSFTNDDYLFSGTSVSVDDLNNFDPFITFVEIV